MKQTEFNISIPVESYDEKVGWFIILNYLASSKMVIKMYSNFFRFLLNVLEIFECQRCDPYMTANRNFVRFDHS